MYWCLGQCRLELFFDSVLLNPVNVIFKLWAFIFEVLIPAGPLHCCLFQVVWRPL